MAGRIRIRETVKNGRVYYYRLSYDNIRTALINLRVKVRNRRLDYNRYDSSTDNVINTSTITTDNDTHITIISGKSERRFELATKKDSKVISFGHLLVPSDLAVRIPKSIS